MTDPAASTATAGPAPAARWLPHDPRVLQLVFLGSFLAFGAAARDFPLWQAPVLLGTCCLTQLACTRALRLPSAGYRSPLITGLGLSLLLRTDLWWIAVLAGALAISSKFLLRVRGKHVFNPGTFGLCCAMLLSDHAWCSPAQWGQGPLLAAWIALFGLSVASRAFRADVSLGFLAAWVLLKAGRVLYLGQRAPVLLHQLETGSLILFAFFMISDSKTTPDRRAGRFVLAAAVALLAFWIQHGLFRQNALIWALFLLSPLTVLLDWLASRTAPTRTEDPACPPSPALPA